MGWLLILALPIAMFWSGYFGTMALPAKGGRVLGAVAMLSLMVIGGMWLGLQDRFNTMSTGDTERLLLGILGVPIVSLLGGMVLGAASGALRRGTAKRASHVLTGLIIAAPVLILIGLNVRLARENEASETPTAQADIEDFPQRDRYIGVVFDRNRPGPEDAMFRVESVLHAPSPPHFRWRTQCVPRQSAGLLGTCPIYSPDGLSPGQDVSRVDALETLTISASSAMCNPGSPGLCATRSAIEDWCGANTDWAQTAICLPPFDTRHAYRAINPARLRNSFPNPYEPPSQSYGTATDGAPITAQCFAAGATRRGVSGREGEAQDCTLSFRVADGIDVFVTTTLAADADTDLSIRAAIDRARSIWGAMTVD